MTFSKMQEVVQGYLNRPPLSDEEKMVILEGFAELIFERTIELRMKLKQAIADNIVELLA